MHYISFSELFQFCTLVISLISLIVALTHKKK